MMEGRSAETHATFASQEPAVNQATALVDRFCAQNGIGVRDRIVLRLIVEELVTNTLRHGRAPASAPITLRLIHRDHGVELHYADRGIAFDPSAYAADRGGHADPIVECLAGGLGWRLIGYYCRLLAYRREGDENRIILTRRLEDGAPAER